MTKERSSSSAAAIRLPGKQFLQTEKRPAMKQSFFWRRCRKTDRRDTDEEEYRKIVDFVLGQGVNRE